MKTETPFPLSILTKACMLGFMMLAAGSSYGFQAQQQSTNSATDVEKDEIEVITVRGIKRSILKSLRNKRYAQQILDTIAAEDIGQLPDENIAEALQRINGVSLSRGDDGEGQSVQIRGDSSNNIEIDGQAIVGSGDNPRSVNFQDLPSELFSGIEVQKTSSADKIEGSLGGTINLKTQKPLDIKKAQLTSLTLRSKYNELAEKASPDLTLFNSSHWKGTSIGDFGINFTANVKEIVSHDEAFGAASWNGAPSRWTVYTGLSSARDNTAFSATSSQPYDSHLDPNQDGVSNENDIFYAPNLWKTFINNRTSDRAALNMTLQWQPNDTSNLWLTGNITQRDDVFSSQSISIQANTGTPRSNEWNIANQYNSFPLASGDSVFEKLNSTSLGDFYAMTSGRIGGMTTIMGASPAYSELSNQTSQLTFGAEIFLSDVFKMTTEVSSSSSVSDTASSQVLMSYDYTQDGAINNADFAAVVDFDERNVDLAMLTYYNPPTEDGTLTIASGSQDIEQGLNFRQQQRNASDIENTSQAARLDFQYELDFNITSLQWGLRVQERSAERVRYMAGTAAGNSTDGIFDNGRKVLPYVANIAVNDDSSSQSVALGACLSNTNSNWDSFSGNLPSSYIGSSCDSEYLQTVFSLPNIRGLNPNTGVPYYQRNGQRYNNMDITERTDAAYIRANFFYDFFNTGIDFLGNIGVRHVKTTIDGVGWIDRDFTENYGFEQVNVGSDYEHSLPSFNGNWLLSDEMVLRIALSKNIARPALNQVAPNFNLNYADPTANIGYAGTGSAGNPALKPRTADNADVSLEWYFNEESLISIAAYYKKIDNLSLLLPAQELELNNQVFLVNQWKNIGSTEIKGLELGWQQPFSFMPGFLKHTGINFNYTHPVEDESLTDGHGDPVVKQGLSSDNVNATLYYDDKTFSMRFAYSYRSEYVRNYQALLGFGRVNDPYRIPQYVDAYGQLDISMNYNVTKRLKLNLSVSNVTDSHSEWYVKYQQLTDRIAQTGRRGNLSLIYRF